MLANREAGQSRFLCELGGSAGDKSNFPQSGGGRRRKEGVCDHVPPRTTFPVKDGLVELRVANGDEH